MKWKKIIPAISLVTMIGAFSANFISANIGSSTGYDFLNSLKDFDWSDFNMGDGIQYLNNNAKAVASSIQDEALNDGKYSHVSNGEIPVGSFLDYPKFNTSFKSYDAIRKQAVTGAPMNWSFMPNGNYVSDFGVTSRAQKYSMKNSILDWNELIDKDSRFNRSYVPLQKATLTSFVYKNKKKDINFNYLGHSLDSQNPWANTIVGSKNPFDGTNLNWQYTSRFVNWAGSTSTGIIVPPSADIVDMAHRNGTEIYGNIFLDGGHGLSKRMLKDFVQKDANGNYAIVDVLLRLAVYEGFDGWFLNDEANGYGPNGTVLDHDTLVEIVRQFNAKSVKNNLNKKIVYYDSWATLSKEGKNYVDKEAYSMTKTMPNGEPLDIQLSFGANPDQNTDFFHENKNYKPENIYTIYDIGGHNYVEGTYDWRASAYGKNYDNKSDSPYNDKVYNSISGYMDNGPAEYGMTSLGIVEQYAKEKNDDIRNYAFANQVSNLFNDIFFNGTNVNQSTYDKGLTNYQILGDDMGNAQYEYIRQDPRIQFKGKETMPKKESTGGISGLIYDYNKDGKGNGFNSNSYGVGNLIHERTVFQDENGEENPIKTNFSTGSGISFVDRDEAGDKSTIDDYPYTNRRLADVLPTYQWDVSEVPSNVAIRDIDQAETDKQKIKTIKPRIDELNGFFDYDDIYMKSNSIALGSAFDQTGKIMDAIWHPENRYIWNIMGTNISNRNHTFSITYKDNNLADIKPIITLSNEEKQKNHYQIIDTTSTVSKTETKDHWKTISFNLNGIDISKDNRLSKIGLLIEPKKEKFKLNVGEFSMDKNVKEHNQFTGDKTIFNDFKCEYRINRSHISDIRIIYDPKEKFDYLEFYLEGLDNKNKKCWYRVGETSADEYYLRNIDTKYFGKSFKLGILAYKNNKIIGSEQYEIK